NHEMQVRAGAVAGVPRARDTAPGVDPLALAHGHRTLHQVQVDAHGAVVVQDADEVAGGVVPTAALVVFHPHHHAATRSDDRRALGHGDIHRVTPFGREVAVLAVGALGQPERAATPGQRITIGFG